MKILHIASEAVPLAKTGGLADVLGALPAASAGRGNDVRLVLPRYRSVDMNGFSEKDIAVGVPLGSGNEWGSVWERRSAERRVTVYLLDHTRFYDREWLYGPPGGEYSDNLERFAFLSRGALKLCQALNWFPDIVHAHDWHAALAPIYLSTLERHSPFKGSASLLTIHNADYQGRFPSEMMPHTGLSWMHYNPEELEFHDQVCLLKGGIAHATILTAVSPTYAEEIQRAPLGRGLEGMLSRRSDDLFGVLNGMDYEIWNPADDTLIPARFTLKDMDGKKRCKHELQKRMGFAVNPNVPLIGLVTRLAWQKGVDLFLEALSSLVRLDVQMVLLGAGDPELEAAVRHACLRWPEKVAAYIGYSDELARQIYAGADFFLMPSRYEPCGLGQMYALRYGTLPVVRATGGLDDTVEDCNEDSGTGNGFKFNDLKPRALVDTVVRAMRTYHDGKDHFSRMQRTAMKLRFSWETSAERYDELYEKALRMARQA